MARESSGAGCSSMALSVDRASVEVCTAAERRPSWPRARGRPQTSCCAHMAGLADAQLLAEENARNLEALLGRLQALNVRLCPTPLRGS